ncbi:MAG TPA: DUF3784 domain-containing protein [Acetivibrio clariflavus]|nr:DUF3784 domain-containing protein [Acetivibrio clariflavus]
MWLFYVIIGAFFIFLGLAIHVFKWYFLIPRYNTMPEVKNRRSMQKALDV